jgi:hypothetical protein
MPTFTLPALIEALETKPGKGTNLAAVLRSLPPDANVEQIADALCPITSKLERFYRVLHDAGIADAHIEEAWCANGAISAMMVIQHAYNLNLSDVQTLMATALGVGQHSMSAAFRERNT